MCCLQELRHAELHLDGARAILEAVTGSSTLRHLRMPHSMYRLTVSASTLLYAPFAMLALD